MVLVIIILVILINMIVEIIEVEVTYYRISFFILFLSFDYNFNVILICTFLMLFYFLI